MASNEPPESGDRDKLPLTNSLPANVLIRQTSGRASKQDLGISAEFAFTKRADDFSNRKFQLPSSTRSTFLMVYSPNGKLVASTHGDHTIYVSDVATGKCVRQLSGHPRTPWCLAFHPVNNDLLASGCLGGQVRVWDLCGGSEIWCSDGQTVIASIAFHPTSDCLLAIATHNEIHFWDWNKKTPFMKIATKHEKERVRFVTFDTTGHKLITGIANRLLYPTHLTGQQTASDDSGEDLTLYNINHTLYTLRSQANDVDEASSNISNAQSNNPDASASRDSVSNIMPRVIRLNSRHHNALRIPQRMVTRSVASSFQSSSSAPEAPSPSSSSSSSSPSSSSQSQFPSNAETRPRNILTTRRSSLTPQTRRRVPVAPGLLNRSEASRTLSTQQNRRLFVREFASQLFSMFASYAQDASSDSENDAMEPEEPPAPSPTRPRTGGVPTLTERYRRFRPLRVGRWNSNIQNNFVIHSPNDPSGSSRQPTPGERGYIFANIHVNHRIQCWTFSESSFPPDISDSTKNVVVPKCKINNDSSVSISSCNQFLAAIIPQCRATDVKISIFSVNKDSLGQKLFTQSLARNVVSVSFSPSAHFLLLGFAADRLMALRRQFYPMGQIFRLPFEEQTLSHKEALGLEAIKCVYQQSDMSCTYRGINCMRWAPVSGQGLMYGTNTGELGLLF